MQTDITEQTAKELLEALGGTYPSADRAAGGMRMVDETYQDILTAIRALVAGGGGGGTPTVAVGLEAVGVDQATALLLAADINYVESGMTTGGVILPSTTPVGKSVTVISGHQSGGNNPLRIYPPVGHQFAGFLPTDNDFFRPGWLGSDKMLERTAGTITISIDVQNGSFTFTRLSETVWACTGSGPQYYSNA